MYTHMAVSLEECLVSSSRELTPPASVCLLRSTSGDRKQTEAGGRRNESQDWRFSLEKTNSWFFKGNHQRCVLRGVLY